jgi:hypothetical protein
MRSIYNLLHFANKTPKHLLISIPDALPNLDKSEGAIISIVSEDNSQAFTLSADEINDFIKALSYAQGALLLRRIAAINAKYITKEVKK